MSTLGIQPEVILQAVFSICAGADVAAAAAVACPQVAGSQFVGEFQEYFSGERRIEFSPEVCKAGSAVALVDCDRDREQALATMERLRASGPANSKVIGVGTSVDAAYLLRVMRAGCTEFLPKPVDAGAIQDALKRVQSNHIGPAQTTPGTGQLLAMVGAKGGVGTTTLAVHLANNLSRRQGKRTLLIDHHYELGHVGLLLGLKNGQYHFSDLLKNANRLDTDLLKGLVTQHHGGLEVLTSPDACTSAYQGTAQETKAVLAFLRTQYDCVVIDASMVDQEDSGVILEMCDELYVVSTPDVAALRDLARRIEHLSLIQATHGRIRVVLNRSTSDDAVTSEQVEAAVRFPVWMTIPNSYSELLKAMNDGEPISAEARSPFAHHIHLWASKLVNTSVRAAQQPASKHRFLDFLRKPQTVTSGGQHG
jgi:pilus assembly protein CpaE